MTMIGIDLGNTTVRMARVRAGSHESLDFEHLASIPSLVAFDGRSWLTGEAARVHGMAKPEEVASNLLQDLDHTWQLGRKKVTAFDLLRRLLETVEQQAGCRDMVLTVPAHFDDARRAVIKQAAESAGFQVHRLLPQPTAAAIGHCTDVTDRQTVLVLDLGGGFFEVSLLEVQDKSFKVQSVHGESSLSGNAIDTVFAENLQARVGVATDHAACMAYAESVKVKLSRRRSVELVVPCHNETVNLGRFTRENFLEIIQPLLEGMAAKALDVVTRSGRSPEQIDRVCLVGLPAQNRLIQDFFRARFANVEIPKSPEMTAAAGAAMVAQIIAAEHVPRLGGSTPTFIPALAGLSFQDVIPTTLSVAMKSDKGFLFKKMRCVPILEKDQPYPDRKAVLGFAETLWTERLFMDVYRGESTVPDQNQSLGRMVFPVSRENLGRHAIIMACVFQLDADGLLTFTAVEMPIRDNTQAGLEALKSHALANDLKVSVDQVDRLQEDHAFKTRIVTIKAR